MTGEPLDHDEVLAAGAAGRAGWAAAARPGRPVVTLTPALRDAALRWIADDPTPRPRASCSACSPPRWRAPRAPPTSCRPDGGPADLRHRRAARAAAGRAGRDEPGRRPPRHRRPRRVAGPPRAARARSSSAATPGTAPRRSPRPRPRCWPAPGSRCRAARPAADPADRVRGAAPRRGGRRADHRVAQPAADNGYKVYLPTAPSSRRRPTRRSRRPSRAAPPARSVPTAARAVSTRTSTDAYLDGSGRLPRGTARDLRVALTPMHGVGGATAVHALRRAGFTDVHVVPAQAVPDPAFPTVAFPNPEEPGATDLLLALAAAVDADLAIALDPDADRCALAVPGRSWRMLTGDETGVLLGDHLLRSGGYTDPLVATTIVSSSMLQRDRRGARRALRRDADRLQVDRPRRARAGVRLRGGARLLRRPGRRAGQGRHLRRGAGLRPRRRAEGRGRGPARPARRAGPRARRAPDRGGVGAAGAGRPRRRRRTAARRPARGLDVRAPGPGRAGAAPRPRAAGDPPVGHRAEAQGVPRGGRAAGRRRARRAGRRAARMDALRDEVAGLWRGS